MRQSIKAMYWSATFVFCMLLGAKTSEASFFNSCTFKAKLLKCPKKVTQKKKQFYVPAEFQVQKLVNGAGHAPHLCKKSYAKPGQTVKTKLFLGREHYRSFFKVGDTIQVNFRHSSGMGRGRRFYVSNTWTYVFPKNTPYEKLVGVKGPDKSLESHAQVKAKVEKALKGLQGKTLRFTHISEKASEGLLLRCRKDRCDDKASSRFMVFRSKHLDLTFVFRGSVVHAKTTEALRKAFKMMMFTFKDPALSAKGWRIKFGSYRPYLVSRLLSAENKPKLKKDQFQMNFNFAVNWLSVTKAGDPYCNAPSAVQKPKICSVSGLPKLKLNVKVALSVPFDRSVRDCTKKPTPKACK